jgi:hypothetical protein
MKKLGAIAQEINSKRNAVAHQGEFCNEDEAAQIIAQAENFIVGLVQLYEPAFALKKRKKK